MTFEYKPSLTAEKLKKILRWTALSCIAVLLGLWLVQANLPWILRLAFPEDYQNLQPTAVSTPTLKPLPAPSPGAEVLLREGLDFESKQAWTDAANRYKTSGEAGMARGWHRLGLLQLDGRLGPDEKANAAYSFARAFRDSSGTLLESVWKLAWTYENGLGVPKDPELSKQMRDHVLGTPATVIADSETREFISLLWEEGKAGRRDLIKAFHLQRVSTEGQERALLILNKACKEGVAEAQFLMGNAFKIGEFGLAADPEKAFEWYEKAAEQKHPEAMLLVSESYEKGQGTEKNTEKAVSTLRAAVDIPAPSPRALVAWGNRLIEGRGVPQDRKGALTCFERAESLEPQSATVQLAQCYEKGWGTGRDAYKAGEHYFHARLFDKMKPLLLKAIQEGKPAAMLLLAEGNLGVGRAKSAESVLLEARKQGVEGADLALGKLYLSQHPEEFMMDGPSDPDAPQQAAHHKTDKRAWRTGHAQEDRPGSGEPFDFNPKKALPHLRMAAARGSREAILILARNGWAESDEAPNPAIPPLLRKAAEAGDLQATILCVQASLPQVGKAKDLDECQRWTEQLTKLLGTPGSQLTSIQADSTIAKWGDWLLDQGGGKPDLLLARKAYQTGARFGSASCWGGLSVIYGSKDWSGHDPVRALYCEGRAHFINRLEGEGC